MRKWSLLIAILGVFILATAPVVAQEQTGAIEGVVGDADGPLPGVRVEAASAAGTRATVTDADGRFRFPSLPPGTYTLSASLAGPPSNIIAPAMSRAVCGRQPSSAEVISRSTVFPA